MNDATKLSDVRRANRSAAETPSVEALEGRRHFDATTGVDVSVVMSGLDSPRGLAFDPRGALYVAEAGRGGGVGAPSVVQRGSTFYYGPTGAVSRLWKGEQARVATGLPSLALANGSRGIGPSDIAFLGAGNASVTVMLEGHPDQRAQLGAAGDGFGRLVDMPAGGDWRFGPDLAGYERTANPDGRQLDSNPYAVLAEPGGRVVVDAGGNSLLRVAADGTVSTIAVLPILPTSEVNSGDPVPTCVTVGPDGAYYVGILAGLPFRDGAARVYRVVDGEAPTEFRTGFKTITDIDFDAAGNLYVLQHAGGATGVALPGSLVRVAPDGTRSTVLGGLTAPTSTVVARDGTLYVTNFGTSAGGGQVLRVVLSEPAAAGFSSAPGISDGRAAGTDEDDEILGGAAGVLS